MYFGFPLSVHVYIFSVSDFVLVLILCGVLKRTAPVQISIVTTWVNFLGAVIVNSAVFIIIMFLWPACGTVMAKSKITLLPQGRKQFIMTIYAMKCQYSLGSPRSCVILLCAVMLDACALSI